jgi:predicted PurR-regulated permease PerM
VAGRQAGRDALAGVAGAVVAVPIVAVITRAVPELRRRDPAPGGP